MGNHTVDCDVCGQNLRGLSGGHASGCPGERATRDEIEKFKSQVHVAPPDVPTLDGYSCRGGFTASPRDQRIMGMTLRDYFAGQALIGVKGWHPADRQGRTVGQICYSIADKMIAARGEGHN